MLNICRLSRLEGYQCVAADIIVILVLGGVDAAIIGVAVVDLEEIRITLARIVGIVILIIFDGLSRMD